MKLGKGVMTFYGNKLGIPMPKTFEEDIPKRGTIPLP